MEFKCIIDGVEVDESHCTGDKREAFTKIGFDPHDNSETVSRKKLPDGAEATSGGGVVQKMQSGKNIILADELYFCTICAKQVKPVQRKRVCDATNASEECFSKCNFVMEFVDKEPKLCGRNCKFTCKGKPVRSVPRN